jgi:hypothetical protein
VPETEVHALAEASTFPDFATARALGVSPLISSGLGRVLRSLLRIDYADLIRRRGVRMTSRLGVG